MLDALKNLFENNVVSEEIKESIEAAWEARIVENRTQVTQQLREEFAQRYEHDRQVMVEAIDRMLGDQLKEEIQQFVEDRNQLAEAKARYAVKMHNDAKLMKEFVTRQLASEVRELHEDQVQMASKFHTLEKFVVEALAQEIAEFHTDKQDIAETKVRLVREGRNALAKMKEQFIQRAAKLVENTVEKTLSKEIGQLKEDIEAARRNDFGRKLFEAYASEYQNSYLNEKSETAKLLKVIDKKDLQVAEAHHAVAHATQVLESKEAQVKALMESKQRQEIMNELVAPLANTQKAIMTELLESVHTTKLRGSFDKYLPAVIAGEAPQKKKALVEAKEVTGNKETHSVGSSEHENNIFNMRRLAGIKH
jgi:ATP-dependent Clp protease adapter protein ClpS